MTTPLISVIMPVYNAEKYLTEAMDSILSQSFANFEFLIFNDCSTDNSRAIIDSYHDNRINFINSNINYGYLFHLNHGIEMAKGKYIARMDADDISLPNRLEKQLLFFNNNPDIVMLGSSAIIINNSGKEIQTLKMYLQPKLIFSNLFFMNMFIHSSIMGEANILKKIKYDHNYYLAEDYYLWSQIALKHKTANIQEPLVKLRVHEESISIQKQEQQEACVKKIFAFHLSQLKINNINEKQLTLHYNLLKGKIDFNTILINDVYDILKWIILLKTQNRNYKIYDKKFFEYKLQTFWNKYFYYLPSSQYGIKLIPFIFNSLSNNFNFKVKILFIYKCLKIEIKNRLCPRYI